MTVVWQMKLELTKTHDMKSESKQLHPPLFELTWEKQPTTSNWPVYSLEAKMILVLQPRRFASFEEKVHDRMQAVLQEINDWSVKELPESRHFRNFYPWGWSTHATSVRWEHHFFSFTLKPLRGGEVKLVSQWMSFGHVFSLILWDLKKCTKHWPPMFSLIFCCIPFRFQPCQRWNDKVDKTYPSNCPVRSFKLAWQHPCEWWGDFDTMAIILLPSFQSFLVISCSGASPVAQAWRDWGVNDFDFAPWSDLLRTIRKYQFLRWELEFSSNALHVAIILFGIGLGGLG